MKRHNNLPLSSFLLLTTIQTVLQGAVPPPPPVPTPAMLSAAAQQAGQEALATKPTPVKPPKPPKPVTPPKPTNNATLDELNRKIQARKEAAEKESREATTGQARTQALPQVTWTPKPEAASHRPAAAFNPSQAPRAGFDVNTGVLQEALGGLKKRTSPEEVRKTTGGNSPEMATPAPRPTVRPTIPARPTPKPPVTQKPAATRPQPAANHKLEERLNTLMTELERIEFLELEDFLAIENAEQEIEEVLLNNDLQGLIEDLQRFEKENLIRMVLNRIRERHARALNAPDFGIADETTRALFIDTLSQANQIGITQEDLADFVQTAQAFDSWLSDEELTLMIASFLNRIDLL